MSRTEKIKALQLAFSTNNLNALKGTDEMTIEAVVVLRGGWYQIVPTGSIEVPEKELTEKEYQEFISCLPLFPDLNNFKKLDLSTWTNEQLEARLLELNNKYNEQD